MKPYKSLAALVLLASPMYAEQNSFEVSLNTPQLQINSQQIELNQDPEWQKYIDRELANRKQKMDWVIEEPDKPFIDHIGKSYPIQGTDQGIAIENITYSIKGHKTIDGELIPYEEMKVIGKKVESDFKETVDYMFTVKKVPSDNYPFFIRYVEKTKEFEVQTITEDDSEIKIQRTVTQIEERKAGIDSQKEIFESAYRILEPEMDRELVPFAPWDPMDTIAILDDTFKKFLTIKSSFGKGEYQE